MKKYTTIRELKCGLRNFSVSKTPLSIAFIKGLESGNYDRVFTLLKQGADPNELADYGTNNYNTTLLHAAMSGATVGAKLHIFVDELIKSGLVDINAPDSYGSTPLLEATRYLDTTGASEYHALCKLLLEHGADPNILNKFNASPLTKAAKAGDAEVVKLLLQHGAKPEAKALWLVLSEAAWYKQQKTVEVLLDAGIDPNTENENGKTFLMKAALESPELVKLFLEAGADPNVVDNRGETVLMYARDVETVMMLLEAGLDVNAVSANGRTPLINVSSSSYTESRSEAIKVLLVAGADPNATDNEGNTALLGATRQGDAASVKLLLDAGANVNVRDKFNCTPITIAAGEGFLEVIKLLVDYGADINTKGAFLDYRSENKTPLQLAVNKGHSKVASFLRKCKEELGGRGSRRHFHRPRR